MTEDDKKGKKDNKVKKEEEKVPDPEANPELKQNTTVRSWKVNIQEIRVTNLMSEKQSLFLVFKIGDSFKLVDSFTTTGKLVVVEEGKRGTTFVSEMQENIERDQSRIMTMSVKHVYKGSYNDVHKEDLVISAWKYSTWMINTFMGEVRVPLHRIITENLCRNDVIQVKHEGSKKNGLRINYRCYFQEIWNYKLMFSDFKVTNLQHNNGKPYSPMVSFALADAGRFSFGTSVSSDTKRNDKNPLWEKIKGEIKYNGALYEMEDQDITITIDDKSGLKKGPISATRVSLKGISTKGSIRVPIKVSLSSGVDNKTEVRGTVGRNTQGNITSTGNKNKKDEEVLAMDFYYTYLEGRITIPEKPKYYQRGDGLILRENGRYLVVQVGKIEGLTPPDNVGIVNSFVTVHWGNQKSSTRTVFDNFSPTFNEEMYFKISLEKSPKDPKFYEEVKSYLKSRPEIVVYVWLDLQNGSYENIGYMKCNLAEIQGQLPEEKGFYDFENKKQVKFMCRTASVRKRVVSSLIDSANTFILLNFYLMPDYDVKKLDVGDLTKVEGDKIDPMVYKSIKELESSEPYVSHKEYLGLIFKGELEIFRDSNFKFIFATDQCNCKRFLPTYLEPFAVDYTPPQSDEYALSQVLTAKDIFSFVNNIPFIEDYKKPELIASPDFILSQNKGTVTDHVIVLACIMMACNYETQEEVGKMKELVETYKKEMVSFENRVFVCVGTNKFSKKRELWLMTFNRSLNSVTMWDVKDGMSYELKGRVNSANPDIIKTLRAYLKYDPTKEVSKEEGSLEEMLRKINQQENPEEEKKKQVDSDDNSEVDFDIDKMMQAEENGAIIDVQIQRKLNKNTVFEEGDRMAGTFNFLENKKNQGAKGIQVNSGNMNAIHDFYVDGIEVKSSDILPWGTIELIFNHKNVWANIQHQNPSKIMYELHNMNQWRPFLSVWNGKVELPWLSKVGAFYSISNLEAPISSEDITRIETMVLKDIKFTIDSQRSSLNLERKFRSPKDKISLLLVEYLKLLHKFETSKETESEVMQKAEKLSKKVKVLIPRDYKFCYLPLRFSLADTERIRSILSENFSDFMKAKDPCTYAYACKVFPFPNKISSIRVIICHVSRIAKTEMGKEEDNTADLDDDTKWDVENVTETGFLEADDFDDL